MEEDAELSPVTPTDQLYHILKTDSFTFCLICLEDINSTAEDVGKHLNSANHAKSIKCVFRACHPSLIDVIEEERFVEIVLKSVFDISVLLGHKTCYLCKSDNYWFCLMCEQNVTERNLGDTIVKQNIVDHVLSNRHVQKVKEVCFLYRLNDKQEFLLLNKSVVFCSVCQEVLQCKEEALLETAVVHLETKHSKHTTTNGLTSSVKQEEIKVSEHCLPDAEILGDHLNTTNIPRTELAGEVQDENFEDFSIISGNLDTIVTDMTMHSNVLNHTNASKSLSDDKFSIGRIICLCLICKQRFKTVSGKSFLDSLVNHFKVKHRKDYIKTPVVGLLNSVTFQSDPNTIQLISTFRKINEGLKRKIKKGCQTYVLRTKKDYFCVLCMVSMSPCLDNETVLLQCFQTHFNSSSHKMCEQEKNNTIKAFKANLNKQTISQLTSQKAYFKRTLLKKMKIVKEKKKEAKIKRKKLKKQNIEASIVEKTPAIKEEIENEAHSPFLPQGRNHKFF